MLDEIKAGDEVFVYGVTGTDEPVKLVVERTTQTRIFVAGRAYTRKGKLVSSAYYGRIVRVSPELEATVQRSKQIACR